MARRWLELVQEFTGGNAEIARSLNNMYQQEGVEVVSQGALDSAVYEYMGVRIQVKKSSVRAEKYSNIVR